MRCGNCGRKNRIPGENLRIRCGRCGETLDPADLPDGSVTAVDAGAFTRVIGKSPTPVLLDCWADWCQPCRMLAPELEALAADLRGRLKVCKMDVDSNREKASELGVQGIPALFLFDRGEIVARFTGYMQRQTLAERVAPFLY